MIRKVNTTNRADGSDVTVKPSNETHGNALMTSQRNNNKKCCVAGRDRKRSDWPELELLRSKRAGVAQRLLERTACRGASGSGARWMRAGPGS